MKNKAQLWSHVSQGLTMTTWYVLIAWLFSQPVNVLLFLAGSVILVILANLQKRKKGLFQLGVLASIAGAGVLAIVSHSVFALFLAVVLYLLQWQRSLPTIYLRESLLFHSKWDIASTLFLLALTGIFSKSAPSALVLPLLISVVVMRIGALAAASQASHAKSGILNWLLVPLIFVGAWALATYGGLILRGIGGAIFWLFQPLIYLIGWLIQWVIEHVHLTLPKPTVQPPAATDSLQQALQKEAGVHGISQQFTAVVQMVLIIIAAVLLFLWIRSMMKKLEDWTPRTSSNEAGEVREFIRTRPSKKRTHVGGQDSPMRLLYRRLLHQVAKKGYQRHPTVTAMQFSRNLGQSQPELGPSMEQVTEAYSRERYGDQRIESFYLKEIEKQADHIIKSVQKKEQ